MKACIFRGTKQIGGSCVELFAGNQRLLLDFGLPLDGDSADTTLVPPVNMDNLCGTVISHPHIDHYGLLHHLPTGAPVLMGAAAKRIIHAAAPFTGQVLPSLDGPCLVDRQPIDLGPFRITPYLVDHSAYDAYALLVEADGKRLFYSGDFRAHGRKARLHHRLISDPPQSIDALLLEGSSLSRQDTDSAFPSESELEEQLVVQLGSTDGVTLFHTSAQNIDRLVTVYRACKRTGRPMVIDLYAAAVLAATGNPHIPQSGWPGVLLYLPRRQAIQVKRNAWFDLLRRHSSHRVYNDQLKAKAANGVFLFRPILMHDLDEAGCLSDARFIHSQWAGYLERGSYASMEAWLQGHGIAIDHLHTSGHASVGDLKALAEALHAKALVPIHSFTGERYPEIFRNVVLHDDGEWWEV